MSRSEAHVFDMLQEKVLKLLYGKERTYRIKVDETARQVYAGEEGCSGRLKTLCEPLASLNLLTVKGPWIYQTETGREFVRQRVNRL